MIRCLCCNKIIENPSKKERETSWHQKCVKKFFSVDALPELDCTEKELEELANMTVNRGLTVPGVQKKLSLHLDSDEHKSRLTMVDYPTGYILKPQSIEYEFLPEAEYMVMKMAEAVRIKVVPNALIRVNGKMAYITKRIDRDNMQMFAMEDFCQLAGKMTEDKYKGSYELCARIIKRYVEKIGIDLTDFYYRVVFCFLVGNSDMHLKNFSLIENKPKSRGYGLSAAYDLLPVNLLVPEDREQVALTLNGKKCNLTKNDFIELANTIGIDEKVAVKLIRRLIKHKEDFERIVDSSYISEELKQGMKQLLEERVEIFKSI